MRKRSGTSKLTAIVITLAIFLVASIGIVSYSAFGIENAAIDDELAMSSEVVLVEYIPPVEEEEPEEEPEEQVEEAYYEPEEYYNDSEYYEEDTYESEYESYSQENGSGLTKQSGVNQYNGRRETYYSSNVLRHYRIDEWHTDENGVWRDSDGYVVVAADDIPEGGLVDTSFGEGKVYDCGVGYDGGTDIYTNW